MLDNTRSVLAISCVSYWRLYLPLVHDATQEKSRGLKADFFGQDAANEGMSLLYILTKV